MGLNVKGVVATQSKDVMFITGRAMAGIDLFINENRRERQRDEPGNRSLAAFSNCSAEIIPDSGMVMVHFTNCSEKRTLQIFIHCDSDNVSISPTTISLSLGTNGNAARYMKMALLGLSVLGDTYYRTDFDDKPYEKQEGSLKNYLETCALGLENPNCASLKRWLDSASSESFIPGSSLHEYMTIKDVIDITHMSYDESKEALAPLVVAASRNAKLALLNTFGKLYGQDLLRTRFDAMHSKFPVSELIT